MLMFPQRSHTICLRKHEFVILNCIASALLSQILCNSREYKNVGLSLMPRYKSDKQGRWNNIDSMEKNIWVELVQILDAALDLSLWLILKMIPK